MPDSTFDSSLTFGVARAQPPVEPPYSADILRRFWAKVDKRGPDECWPWLASKRGRGYGAFGVRAGNVVDAHRISLQIALGRPLLPGENSCHKCDSPPCCNPAHLFAGSGADNMQDCARKGRTLRGERSKSSVLVSGQVLEIRARAKAGEEQKRLAAEFGVSRATVCMIVSGKRWGHL